MTLDDSVETPIYTAPPEPPQAGDTRRCPYCGNPATHPLTTIPLLLGTTQLLFNVQVRHCPAPGCGLMWVRPHDAQLSRPRSTAASTAHPSPPPTYLSNPPMAANPDWFPITH